MRPGLRAKQIGFGCNGLGRTKTEQNEAGERSTSRGSGRRHVCTCTKELEVIGQENPEMDRFQSAMTAGIGLKSGIRAFIHSNSVHFSRCKDSTVTLHLTSPSHWMVYS